METIPRDDHNTQIVHWCHYINQSQSVFDRRNALV